ncbi:MAG: type I restriction-modification enzyme R subunit C-terminal domain-containing protein, partial [Verrucomicrobiales bacterium]
DPPPNPRMLKVKLADGKARKIQHMVQTSFWGPDGKPLSSEEFLQQLFGDLPDFFSEEDQLREIWSEPDTRKRLLEGLSEKGYSSQQLNEIRKLIDAEKSDLFDVLAYIAFSLDPVTREQRVVEHKDLIFSHYDDKQQAFLDFVLTQYINEGVGELQPERIASFLDLKYGGLHEAKQELGEPGNIRKIFIEFQRHLFAKEA